MSPPASTSYRTHRHAQTPRPAHGLGWRARTSAVLLLLSLTGDLARAAVVEFTQASFPSGLLAGGTDYIETTTVVSTQSAPASLSSGTAAYSFTEWTLNGVRASDAYGQALNPATFILYEPTTAIARYLPTDQDSDADGVPDWFELRYIGNLSQSADSDADQDGLSLAIEQTRGTSPVLGDQFATGGQSRRRADRIISYQAPAAGSVVLSFATQPAGLLAFSSQTVQAWTETTLPGAPATTNGYHFSGWLVNGSRVDDPTQAPPFRMTIGVNTTATARYTLDAADSDADRVPDWFELLYHDTLLQPADYDGEGDGLGLADEAARATSPRLVDTFTGDGFSRRRAANTLGLNLSGYIPYAFQSDPAGLLSSLGNVASGTVVESPDMALTVVSGYAFTHWDVGGVRQIDPLTGGAATKLRPTITAPLVATAHFVLPTTDADSDGVPDWYELRHYGDLSVAPSADTDGDGLGLREEAARGGSPLLRDTFTGGGLSSRRMSGLTTVDLQFFERLRRVLSSGVLAEVFSPDPKSVTGQNLGTDASPALGDWDGDGDLDLFVASRSGLTVYENVGTRHTLRLENRSAAFSGIGANLLAHPPARIALGDWNGDGRADLLIGGSDGVLQGFVSSGSFASPPAGPTVSLATGSTSAIPALGDLDGDGAEDLLVLLADGTTRLYPNTRETTPFTAASAAEDYLGTPISSGSGLAIGDISGDGRLDIVASDLDGRLWEFHRAAEGDGLSLRSKVWAGSGAGFAPGLAIALGDLEGDGDTDAVGGTRDGALVGLRDPRVGRPVGLVAASGARSIELSWDPDRQERIKGYHVYRAATASGPFERITTLPLSLPAYSDDAVTTGQSYAYRVTGLTDAYLPGNSLPRSVESLPSEIETASAGLISFAVRPAHASAGKVVHVRIAIANPFAISGTGLQLKLAYNPALLTPVTQINSNQGTVAPSAIGRDLVLSDNAPTAAGQLVITGSAGALQPGEGTLFTLSFRVAAGAPSGASSTVSLTEVSARDTDGHILNWECAQNGAFTVSGIYAEGDLTGDGAVDKADQTLLSELLKLNARPPSADELAAGDLNADGVLDQDDFVLLKRLLNGRPLE